MAYSDWTKLYKEATDDGMKNATKIAEYIISNTKDTKKPARGRVSAEYKESVVAWVKRKGPIKEGLARLIEADMNNANLIVAAQAIPDIFQDMVEKCAGIEKTNILPLQGQLSEQFGSEVATQFAQPVLAKIREIQDEIMAAKDFLDQQVKNVETVVNGGQMPTDMDMAEPEDAGMGMDMKQAPVAPQDQSPDNDLPSDEDIKNAEGGGEEAPVLGSGEGPAGRARKESSTIRGFSLSENKPDHMVFGGGATFGSLKVGDKFSFKDDETVMKKISATRYETKDGKKFTTGNGTAVKLRESLTMRGREIMEAIERLRKSSNPDVIVLDEFRKNLKNYTTVKEAAVRTAKTFRIDLSDVIDVVKEAKTKVLEKKNDHWIEDIKSKNKGKFSAKAKKAGKTTSEFAKEKEHAPGKLGKEARAAENLAKARKVSEEKKSDDPCWKGYKQIGMKKKNGKEVPNCVPDKKKVKEDAGNGKPKLDYKKFYNFDHMSDDELTNHHDESSLIANMTGFEHDHRYAERVRDDMRNRGLRVPPPRSYSPPPDQNERRKSVIGEKG